MDENETDNSTGPVEEVYRSSYRVHIQNRRSAIRDEEDLVERVKKVLVCMDGLGLDLPILLDALSWGSEALISENNAKYHRALLMNSQLPEMLACLSCKLLLVYVDDGSR